MRWLRRLLSHRTGVCQPRHYIHVGPMMPTPIMSLFRCGTCKHVVRWDDV